MAKTQKMFSFGNAVTDGLTHRFAFPEHVSGSCLNCRYMAGSNILRISDNHNVLSVHKVTKL